MTICRNWGAQPLAKNLRVIFQAQPQAIRKTFAQQAPQGKLSFPQQTWCTANALQTLTGVAVNNSGIPCWLCSYMYLHSYPKCLIPVCLGPSKKVYLGASDEASLLGEKEKTLKTLLLLWLSTLPLLALIILNSEITTKKHKKKKNREEYGTK